MTRPSANIPEVTRARVRAAVAELNYRPNAGARALASRKTGIYGLTTAIVSAPYAADIIKGVQDRAWAEGKVLLIAASEDSGGLDPEIRAAIGRRAGYERALTEAGLEIDETLVAAGDGTADDGYAGARRVLDLPNPPTALFCGADRIAMGAFDAIKERGRRIPEDIAVIGFDNQELISEYLRPKLTTIALPFEEMDSRGVGLLSSARGESGQTFVVDCPLIDVPQSNSRPPIARF